MLNKIRAIFAGAGVALVAGLVTYVTTSVDYAAAFGPGVGVLIAGVLGYLVPEAGERITAYLKRYETV